MIPPVIKLTLVSSVKSLRCLPSSSFSSSSHLHLLLHLSPVQPLLYDLRLLARQSVMPCFIVRHKAGFVWVVAPVTVCDLLTAAATERSRAEQSGGRREEKAVRECCGVKTRNR